jgi:type II restriction/modification system DNA methylase subunit YeeA
VLDPACGSGNFLYVALRQLHDLEKEVIILAGELTAEQRYPAVSLAQLHGIEINEYAYELAQATIWIGHIQWLRENGFGFPSLPILKSLETIQHMDAILRLPSPSRKRARGESHPSEPTWPPAEIIIGNPPFLGGNKIRAELGAEYVAALFKLYEGRVPAFADLVCYWFEKARAMIEQGQAKRAGLLATNSIRGGANRHVLERIKETGDIFWAISDHDWILEGANVFVSMVCFDTGAETMRLLDNAPVTKINPDLTATIDFTIARRLKENADICFYGSQQKGSFDITPTQAKELLASLNSFGRSNHDVIKRSVNAMQLLRGGDETWVIDFGVDMPVEEAALYEAPFEYVKKVVYPERKDREEKIQKEYWWLHARPSPRYREILGKQKRYIASPVHAKYRIFVWLDTNTLADHAIVVFARDDDYFFGVLHSKPHELWALQQGTALGQTPRYTPTTTFETYPFPWPPGQEPKRDPRIRAIAQAACELVQQRDAWLNPPGADESELKKRTLTNLYNQRPTWLDLAHRKLDHAVLDAYGWPHDLSDAEILERLLALNLERAAAF